LAIHEFQFDSNSYWLLIARVRLKLQPRIYFRDRLDQVVVPGHGDDFLPELRTEVCEVNQKMEGYFPVVG
jgi:hypothetical protein